MSRRKQHWCPRQMGDTRRERERKVYRTFHPLRKLVADLRAGEIDVIGDVPVHRVGDYAPHIEVFDTLDGFQATFKHLMPGRDLSIFLTVGRKLKNDEDIFESELAKIEAAINECEARYRTLPLKEVQAALRMAELEFIVMDAVDAAEQEQSHADQATTG